MGGLKDAGHAPSPLAAALSSSAQIRRSAILRTVLDGRPCGYYDGRNLPDVIIQLAGSAS
jgi:hypothetical protein